MDIELDRRSKARATFEIKSIDAVPGGSSAPGQVSKSERRGSFKATLEFKSVDAVPSGSSAPGQVPKSDKSTAEASP